MSKTIVIQEDTNELLQELRIGDETYNSIIWRNLREDAKNKKITLLTVMLIMCSLPPI